MYKKETKKLHGDNRPPKSNRNAGKLVIGIWLKPLSIVDERGENDNKQDEKKYE